MRNRLVVRPLVTQDNTGDSKNVDIRPCAEQVCYVLFQCSSG